ncbi:MAG: hypothetical protein P8X79_06595 [Reinekea sp.]
MIPFCFPKIGVNLWVHLQFLKRIEINGFHSASTLESRIQVQDTTLVPAVRKPLIPLCFPKIGVNLWVYLQFLKNK